MRNNNSSELSGFFHPVRVHITAFLKDLSLKQLWVPLTLHAANPKEQWEKCSTQLILLTDKDSSFTSGFSSTLESSFPLGTESTTPTAKLSLGWGEQSSLLQKVYLCVEVQFRSMQTELLRNGSLAFLHLVLSELCMNRTWSWSSAHSTVTCPTCDSPLD